MVLLDSLLLQVGSHLRVWGSLRAEGVVVRVGFLLGLIPPKSGSLSPVFRLFCFFLFDAAPRLAAGLLITLLLQVTQSVLREVLRIWLHNHKDSKHLAHSFGHGRGVGSVPGAVSGVYKPGNGIDDGLDFIAA